MDIAAPLREAIQSQLASGRWSAGQRLPPERELSEQFGLSRTTVRRVLAQFKQQKMIRQVVGSGTYVCEGAGGPPRDELAALNVEATSPAELMEARLVLEPALIDMVIGNATPVDFARMQDCCDRAEAATSLEEFEHWDAILHEAIAQAAHNSFMLNVFRLINQVRARGEWGLLKRRSVTPQRRLVYQREHRQIVDALRQRDGEAARRATLAHLEQVRRNLLGH
jgi:GntR family uxuAB operon transcriptional repressor